MAYNSRAGRAKAMKAARKRIEQDAAAAGVDTSNPEAMHEFRMRTLKEIRERNKPAA